MGDMEEIFWIPERYSRIKSLAEVSIDREDTLRYSEEIRFLIKGMTAFGLVPIRKTKPGSLPSVTCQGLWRYEQDLTKLLDDFNSFHTVKWHVAGDGLTLEPINPAEYDCEEIRKSPKLLAEWLFKTVYDRQFQPDKEYSLADSDSASSQDSAAQAR